jgi:hypothetical protein
MVFGVLGTAGIVVSMFLSWRSGGVHPSDVPFAFLFDSTTTSSSPTILLALIPFAAILGIGSLMPRAAGARVIGALGVLAVVVLFAVQLGYVADRIPGTNMWNLLETGWYVAAIAGLVGLISGFMPSGWTRRQRTDTDYGEEGYDDGRSADYDERRTV